MIGSVLQSEPHSALELFHSSWTTTGPVSQARKRQKICLLGRAMFQGHLILKEVPIHPGLTRLLDMLNTQCETVHSTCTEA